MTFKRLCHDWQLTFYTDGSGIWVDNMFEYNKYQIANGLRPEQIHVLECRP
ncbi:hypothetical protein XSR1_50060 [Xenorhabdus szentirmaii DSM 16338]|uniref:Uncharacterized protein n=1 Tax=Xenorhabdus szentirmaii DSM 16338 TaxID=1427518 RepID=W1J475_9GAMM|nr:hypothetical protein XSR1_50060 [Xenorhabdus szentirmaii DSM 16338]